MPDRIADNLPEGSENTLATRYTRKLLKDLGASGLHIEGPDAAHPVKRWADCGLLWLTGERAGEPVLCPVPLPGCADGALTAFRLLTKKTILPGIDGGQLLTERAAIAGFQRNGAASVQGHCRILSSRDGHIAANLAREDDWLSVPAWLGREGDIRWETLAEQVGKSSTSELLDQAHLLGLAVVDAAPPRRKQAPWLKIRHDKGGSSVPKGNPKVLDLSSLWAGPLCSHLWQLAGANVIKVESAHRPDGARAGSAEFFNLLNRGKRTITLDLQSKDGQSRLLSLIGEVDIVLEASRPRALRQMGIDAEAIIDNHPGLTWVSITGYGREEPEANRIAYGDDAGIAAGLSSLIRQTAGRWLVCGDAVADPLTGLHCALAGWAGWMQGGGKLFDIALARTVGHCISATAPADGDYGNRYRQWRQYLSEHKIPILKPRRRYEAPASAH